MCIDSINKDDWILKEKPRSVQRSASKTYLVAKKNKKKNKSGDLIEEEAILKIQPQVAIANEIVAYHLAKFLELTITQVQILPKDNIKSAGVIEDGTISFRIPTPHDVWFNLPPFVKDNPRKYIHNYEQFALLCVFDIFICNPDRHDRNLLALDLLTGKLLVYIIDHGHSLLGIDGASWGRNIKREVESFMGSFSKIYHDLALVDFELFESAIQKVKALNDQQIDKIVNSVPEKYLLGDQKVLLNQGLKERRGGIESLVKVWYNKLQKVGR